MLYIYIHEVSAYMSCNDKKQKAKFVRPNFVCFCILSYSFYTKYI